MRACGIAIALALVLTHTLTGEQRPVPAPPSPEEMRALAGKIIEAFQREFGELIVRPAISGGVTCKGERYVTSVAYRPLSDNRSDVLIVQFTADGTLRRRTRLAALTPRGRFRVLTFLVDHPVTLGADGERLWRGAQSRINSEHKTFADTKGYAEPLIVFDNTNLLVKPSEVGSLELEALQKLAGEGGLGVQDYDVFITIDLDPSKLVGGYAVREQRSVYVGNYSRWKSPLDERQWGYVAATAYGHEVAHLWGWEHDWTPSCGPARPPFEPFITDPALFGWIDLDGDDIPEIDDRTPYGRTPR